VEEGEEEHKSQQRGSNGACKTSARSLAFAEKGDSKKNSRKLFSSSAAGKDEKEDFKKAKRRYCSRLRRTFVEGFIFYSVIFLELFVLRTENKSLFYQKYKSC